MEYVVNNNNLAK